MINKTKKFITLSLVVALALIFSFPLMGLGASADNAQSPSTPSEQPLSCYDKIVGKISKEKGISQDEAKALLDARLTEIAKKKGITLDELKKQMAEDKCPWGHKGRKGCQKPLDESKLKELAEKKGISVEELKEKIKEHESEKVES